MTLPQNHQVLLSGSKSNLFKLLTLLNKFKKIYSKLTTNQESALITITNPKKY